MVCYRRMVKAALASLEGTWRGAQGDLPFPPISGGGGAEDDGEDEEDEEDEGHLDGFQGCTSQQVGARVLQQGTGRRELDVEVGLSLHSRVCRVSVGYTDFTCRLNVF
jgi:hypothetical protein